MGYHDFHGAKIAAQSKHREAGDDASAGTCEQRDRTTRGALRRKRAPEPEAIRRCPKQADSISFPPEDVLKRGAEDNPWLTVASERVYDNPWISVREDRVVRPSGEPGIYGVVHYKNVAVGILPVEEDHTYLVGQYRYPLGRYSWEIPEGGCPEGEEPLRAAQRELQEETGLKAKRWKMLGEAHLSNSVADEYAVWFLATELTPGEQQPEDGEVLEVRRVPLREALDMALGGQITDALSLLAIMSYTLGRPTSG